MRLTSAIAAACLLLLGAATPAVAGPVTATTSAAPTSQPASSAPTSAAASPSKAAPSTGAAPSSASGPAPSSAPTTTSSAAAPTSQVATAAASQNNNPYGYLSFSVSPGQIHFDGYALDPSDYNAPVTAILTINGDIVAYTVANRPSPQLYPYGVAAPHGLNGTLPTSLGGGTASVCMFLINVGPGAHAQECFAVKVASMSPSGGVSATFDNRGNINITAYAYDPSSYTTSLGVWLVDNGSLKAATIANEPQPSLVPYGIGGQHGASTSYFAGTAGKHDICVYAINIGAGENAWVACQTVIVTETGGFNDPRGDFSIVDDNGGVSVVGWAFDANAYNQPTTVMWTVDGAIVTYSVANLASPYLGLPGNHATVARVNAPAGKRSVCMFVGNLGPGASQLVKCADVTVKSGWTLPVKDARYTSCYCARWGTFHNGIDLAAASGTPMYAAADGVVTSAGPVNGYGNLIVIKHPASGTYTAYAHMYSVGVYVGQYVSMGQQIATVGAYGNITGPHLHLEMWYGPDLYQGRLDPAVWLADHGVQLPPYTP
ncbi:M23 family metallopeptidase [Cumulibacter manganitolerans]|uniref:M23 family metallopeptidase n=1 Tax=Cumulibacter manganitolerans TaxID=1884992 RepID=UPI001294E059|nr:M23 family metallopeptidase [Cumulibacter manganitolerans]